MRFATSAHVGVRRSDPRELAALAERSERKRQSGHDRLDRDAAPIDVEEQRGPDAGGVPTLGALADPPHVAGRVRHRQRERRRDGCCSDACNLETPG